MGIIAESVKQTNLSPRAPAAVHMPGARETPVFGAISIAPAARRWLAYTQQARVLHVFDRACNLINQEGEILSVVTPELGDGPFHVVIREQHLRALVHSDPMLKIMVLPDRLLFAGVSVDVVGAVHWSPRPDWEELHLQRVKILAQVLAARGWIMEHARDGSLMTAYPGAAKSGSLGGDDRCLVPALGAAVARADVRACRQAARSLAGLGPGLTPAGDDCIMGAIFAAWILHPERPARSITQALAQAAIPRTTSLSAAWLRAAARGEAGVAWHRFLRCLMAASASALLESAGELLAIGHTSGADALAGFLGSFVSWRSVAAC